HIHWIKMKDNKRVSSSRSMNGYARFRDVRQAPDGKIYAMTESPNRFILLRSNIPILTSIEDNDWSQTEKDFLYPNPSAEGCTVSFNLTYREFVSIKVYNTNGSLLKELTSQSFDSGNHTLAFGANDFPQGIYFIEINKGGVRSFLKWVKQIQ
ncbi:MAG: T9SS type A sorting domain-containing protein, partial [Candidatus Paceibacterota bacterium]